MNEKLRVVFSRLAISVSPAANEARLDVLAERVERILLVRANFRMGSAVLATPAIFGFHSHFPQARIDFVGSPMSATLFQNLPIDHHYAITRRFPHASWAYAGLLSRLRRAHYDLAVELGDGSSSMDSFLVGFSGARFRVGREGKRDGWFNVKIPRTPERNRYHALPAFMNAMGLTTTEVHPRVVLSEAETAAGKKKIESISGRGEPVVGVFIGGRARWGKRWPIENFLTLTHDLDAKGIKVVVFAGPEERALMRDLPQRVPPGVTIVSEPSVRLFAAMISHCQLFVTSDTGPMHLSCALGVRTVALFQKRTFQRWGPPADLAQIVYRAAGISVEEVLEVCVAELSRAAIAGPLDTEPNASTSAVLPHTN